MMPAGLRSIRPADRIMVSSGKIVRDLLPSALRRLIARSTVGSRALSILERRVYSGDWTEKRANTY